MSGSGTFSANDTVVGNESLVEGDFRSGSLPEKRTEEEVVPSDSVVLLDHLGVDIREPKEKGQDTDDKGGEDNGKSDSDLGKFAQVETGGTLVDWLLADHNRHR